MRQRFLPLTAGERHAPPERVLAPQRRLNYAITVTVIRHSRQAAQQRRPDHVLQAAYEKVMAKRANG
jgi:hypothetical protein